MADELHLMILIAFRVFRVAIKLPINQPRSVAKKSSFRRNPDKAKAYHLGSAVYQSH